MQQLLGDKLGTPADANSFLHEVFLQRLPPNVRMVLASVDAAMDLNKLADMADKVMEIATPTVSAVTTDSDYKQLREEVARLADVVASLTTLYRRRNSSRSRRPQSPAPPEPSLAVPPGTVKLLRNAGIRTVGETPRPDASGDRCSRPSSQSPFLCKSQCYAQTFSCRDRI